MPRHARVVLPNYPHHIVQRGHNRQPVFFADEDYLYYLENLVEFKKKLGCRVYSFCLMSNHVHLVIDPGEDPENLGRLMKRVAGRQTRYVNRIDSRSGTLWEGRFKSSPIDTNDYLLACCRYIEMNPVRAGIVGDPIEYRWSSHADLVGKVDLGRVDFSTLYLGMGKDKADCQNRYREFILNTIPDSEMRLIQKAIQQGKLTGSNKFVDEIEERLAFRIELRGQGRPRKAVNRRG